MADNRDLVHINKLDAFRDFLRSRGWTLQDPKGDYEIIRATHPTVKTPIVYHKRIRTDHLTCMSGLPATLARQFIQQQRRKGSMEVRRA